MLFNPNPIGLFWGLESIGGGDFRPPPQISATNGPIDLKIGSRKTSQVEYKKIKNWTFIYLFLLIKILNMQIFDKFLGKIGIFI